MTRIRWRDVKKERPQDEPDGFYLTHLLVKHKASNGHTVITPHAYYRNPQGHKGMPDGAFPESVTHFAHHFDVVTEEE